MGLNDGYVNYDDDDGGGGDDDVGYRLNLTNLIPVLNSSS